jgi:hypothetical protein
VDVSKPAPDRLRRCFRYRKIDPPAGTVPVGGTVRDLFPASQGGSVRGLIRNTVVAFVPTDLPLTSGPVTARKALVSFGHGLFSVGAAVETSSTDPVAVIVGFHLNNDPHWSVLICFLNVDRQTWASSTTGQGVFNYDGGSHWLEVDGFSYAAANGVIIGLHHTLDMQTDVRTFVEEWGRTQAIPLDPNRLMSLNDAPGDYPAGLDFGPVEAGTDMISDDDSDDSDLSVSLAFE